MILHRRPLADRGSPGRTNGNAVINPRIRVCSTVVLRSCLQPRATALWCLRSVSVNGGMPAPSVIDNEHQSSSVTTGCPTVCSTTSTLSSTTAATHGTSWRLSPGLSCPSACAIGPIGSDQRDLVLEKPSPGYHPIRSNCTTPGLITASSYCRIAFILIDAKDPLQAFCVPNPGGLA